MKPDDRLRSWDDFTFPQVDRILVVGNGPSRLRESLIGTYHRTEPDYVICCNAAAFELRPDLVVAYDVTQIDRIVAELDVPLMVPESKQAAARNALAGSERESCVYLMSRHHQGRNLSPAEPWDPMVPIGHISGLLAYCVALRSHARARARGGEVVLCGMDCSVEPVTDRKARRSCMAPGTPGYHKVQDFERGKCVKVCGAEMPRAWTQQRDSWLRMIAWADRHGISTFRTMNFGALTALPVWGDRDADESRRDAPTCEHAAPSREPRDG